MEKKVAAWLQNQLISAEQAERIRSFEQQTSGKRSWALWGAVAVGVSAIGIGVISVVAANWQAIPGSAKLTIYLAMQATLGYVTWRWRDAPGLVFEALLALFALFFFAGIGLTGQVFHLRSDGYSALFFWCSLTFMLTYLSSSRPLSYIWVIVFMNAFSFWALTNLQLQDDGEAIIRFLWRDGLAIYGFLAIGFLQYHKLRIPTFLSEALRVLPFLTIFIGGSVLGTAIWYIGLHPELSDIGSDAKYLMRLQGLPWVGAILVAAAVLLRQPQYDPRLQWSLVSLFLALAAFITAPIFFNLPPNKALGATFSIIVWGIAGIAAIYANRRRVFDLITLCICLRLLFIYFEVFGSMLATGIGLIISGFIILGIAYVWHHYRGKLAAWIGQPS